MLLETLLDRIPSDTEERVNRTRDRLKQNIREALRRETGLRFWRAGEEATEGATVRIHLVPGLPVSLQSKTLDEKYKLAALIAPWKHTLEALRDAGKETTELVREFMADPLGRPLVEGFAADRQVVEFAENLLASCASSSSCLCRFDSRQVVASACPTSWVFSLIRID